MMVFVVRLQGKRLQNAKIILQKRESAINFAGYRVSQEGHAFQDGHALKKLEPRETGVEEIRPFLA